MIYNHIPVFINVMDKLTKNKYLIGTALISSILSILVHSYLALTHYKIKFGLSEGKSLCNINATFNCDTVATSRYASFLDLPIASWGAATHFVLSLILILWFIGLLKNPSRVLRIALLLSAFIALISIVMGGISTLLLSTYCIFCIVTYLLSFIITATLWIAVPPLSTKYISTDISSLWKDHKWISFLFLLIPGIGYLSNSMILDEFGVGQMKIAIEESLQNWRTATQRNFDNTNGLIFKTNADEAKMVIVEFADFLCPHCKSAAIPLHNFAENHKNVTLVFKSFPLDGVCNEQISHKGDGLRCQLAYAALCAETINHQGWLALEYIFSRQNKWNLGTVEGDLKNMAVDLKISYTDFKSCLESDVTHRKILAQAKEGTGIYGTPTIFVNGKELSRGQFLPILEAVRSEMNL